MWFWLWLIMWLFTLFCFLPTYNIKIARCYGRWFNIKIHTSLWEKLFYIGVVITVMLMFVDLLMGE